MELKISRLKDSNRHFMYLSVSQLFDPAEELITPDSVRHHNSALADQRVIRLEALLAEDLLEEGFEQPLVEFIVHLASVDTLGKQGSHGSPRNFLCEFKMKILLSK